MFGTVHAEWHPSMQSPGASVHSLSKRRDILSSAGIPWVSAHFATPVDVPMPHKSTRKEWWQRCWGAALGSTEGYTALFKLGSPLRYEEQSGAIWKYDLQTPSTEVALGQAFFTWMWRATGVQVWRVQGARPKKPMVCPSHSPWNLQCILPSTESGLVLFSCQLSSSGAAADFIKLTPV